VLAEVKARGDAALREYTERFDGVVPKELRVDPAELEAADEIGRLEENQRDDENQDTQENDDGISESTTPTMYSSRLICSVFPVW